MKANYVEKVYKVKGMSCSGCEEKIEQAVTKLTGVKTARAFFASSTLAVAHDESIVSAKRIAQEVAKAGYTMLPDTAAQVAVDTAAQPDASGKKSFSITQFFGIMLILAAVAFIISKTVGFNFIPEVSQNMGYGMLFLVGLLTSLHCVAMCGGINMSQCIPAAVPQSGVKGKLLPSAKYNLGRVISYTVIGGIAGAIGSAVSFSGWAKGVIAVLSGLFMIIMGISMLGIFPWMNKITPRMPRFLRTNARKAGKDRGPFIVGLLNGLMPCGPLQAMQLYAVGTGSLLMGASSMFFFSLGTVPLMFGLGAISTMLSSRFTSRMLKVSAALVLLLGFIMVNRGLALSGVQVIPAGKAPSAQTGGAAESGTQVKDGMQNITAQLSSGRYPQITVQKGIPVRWNLKADAGDINGCNGTLVIPQFNKQVKLKAGDNIIEFTPEQTGTIPYSCWMGMITSQINVVDAPAGSPDASSSAAPAVSAEAQATAAPALGVANAAGLGAGSCCAAGSLATDFANGNIPSDDIQVAKDVNGVQEVTITVNDRGYSPAVAVVQRGKKVKIRFVAEKLNICNSLVAFPELNGQLDLSVGELETPAITPDADFGFQCSMGMLHGFVKVVDDINNIDYAQVKQDVANYKPAGGSGMACCG